MGKNAFSTVVGVASALVFITTAAPATAQVFSQARSDAYQQRRDWADMAQYARAWTQAQPNSLDAWSDLAVAEGVTGLGHPTEAVPAFQHVVAIKPSFAAGWEGLGVNELSIPQPSAAVGALTRATRLEPNNPSFLNNLAAAYRDEGDIASALKTLDREPALAVRLHDATVWFALGNAYSRLHDGAHALRAYRETVALRPDFAQARQNVAALEAYMAPPARTNGTTLSSVQRLNRQMYLNGLHATGSTCYGSSGVGC